MGRIMKIKNCSKKSYIKSKAELIRQLKKILKEERIFFKNIY